MPRGREDRLVWRVRGGQRRAYGRFTDYLDVGGKPMEALVPAGQTMATDDEVVARELVAARLRDFQERRRDRTLLGITRNSTFANFVSRHLRVKRVEEDLSEEWMVQAERHLTAAIEFFDQLRDARDAERLDCDPSLASELGADRDLSSITVGHVKAYRLWLAARPGGRKRHALATGAVPISGGTQRHFLNSLGNLFAAAIEAEVYEKANPVWALRNKPSAAHQEARWYEVWEGALLIESARTFPYDGVPDSAGLRLGAMIEAAFGPPRAGGAEAFAVAMRLVGKLATAERILSYVDGETIPSGGFLEASASVITAAGAPVTAEWMRRGDGHQLNRAFRPPRLTYPLLAGYLLTGMRETELYGLELDDVSQFRRRINLRENNWRGLKTDAGARSIPYWPQLRLIWEEWLDLHRTIYPPGFRLLFPSPRLLEREGREGMLTDTRKALDAVAGRVGFVRGDLRTKVLRHTYCSTRSQTLDRGAPVTLSTVAHEMGHDDDGTTRRIYLHFQDVPHRSAEVEYRVEQHEEIEELVKRLRPLQAA